MANMVRAVDWRVIIESAFWFVFVLLWAVGALFRPEIWFSLGLRAAIAALLFRLSLLIRLTRWAIFISAATLVLLVTVSALTGNVWIINGTVVLVAAIVLRYLAEYIEWQFFTKILEPYEKMVVSRMGGEYIVKGPGPVTVHPFWPYRERSLLIDMREAPFPIPVNTPTCYTQDQYQLKLDVEIFWKVVQPSLRVTQVKDIQESLTRLIPGAVLEIVGKLKLEELLNDQALFGDELVAEISNKIRPWGVCVTRVVIKQILPTKEVSESLNRARAAEQERKEKETRANADKYVVETEAKSRAKALRELSEAAREIDQNTLNLKFLESLVKLGEGSSTKYILPLEIMDLLKSFTPGSKPPAP